MAPGKDKNIAAPDRPALLSQDNWLLLVYAIPLEGDKGPDLCGVGTSFCARAHGLSTVGLVDCKPNTLHNALYVMKYSQSTQESRCIPLRMAPNFPIVRCAPFPSLYFIWYDIK